MSDPKLPLSVIIILDKSKDNPYLSQLLDSVYFASEILLIDSGQEKIDDFSKARNKSVKVASQDWILFLDSDEVLEKNAREKIEKLIEGDKYDLVSVLRSDIFLGKKMKWGETRNTNIIRLGKKSAMKFVRPVHEVVDASGKRIKKSTIKINHYAHQSIFSFLNKVTYYSSLEADYRIKSRKNYFVNVFAQLLFFPPLKFINNYFIKLGFLDGWRGFTYAHMMSIHSLLVRIFILERNYLHSEK